MEDKKNSANSVNFGPYWLRVQSQGSNFALEGTQFWEFDEDLAIASVAYAKVNVGSFKF